MKKILVFSLFLIACFFAVFNVFTSATKQTYKELVKNHPIQKRLKFSKEERKKKGIPPNRYFDKQYLLEMDPNTGKTYPENLLKAKKRQANTTVKFSKVPGQNNEMAWEERGPNNIAGRTRVVFYDPNDNSAKRVFAGGVSGGLWVNNDITDEASVWSQVGIDENLAVSCYAIDPNDSDIWYVGTGEVYTGDDGVGNGVWITQNGGNTWSQLLSIDLDNNHDLRPYAISQILAWNNNGTTEVYFSTGAKYDIDPVGYNGIGWWKVVNNSFVKVNFNTPQGTAYVFSDVEVATDNSIWVATKANIYGDGGGKVFRSTDGVNFTEKYSFTNGGRVELAVSKLNSNTIYVLAETDDSSNVELVKTTNGNNFVSIAKPNDVDTQVSENDFARDQGFYNLTLEVDPTNDNILYAGGINLFRSENAGQSWSQISKWSNNNNLSNLNVSFVHPDQHRVALSFIDSNQGVFANDGGVYYSSDLSKAAISDVIVERNKNYNITQFYSAAISQDENNELLLGGAQDNGSLFSFEAVSGINSFTDIYGGDGFQTFIDKDNEYLIVSYVGNFYASYPLPLSGPSDVVEIVNDSNSGDFANVADLDDNLDILYTNGTVGSDEKISRYTDLLGSPVRSNFSNSKLFENPTAIKVSPFTTNSSTVFIGTEGPSILKVTNLNTDSPVWTNIDLDNSIELGAISDIDFGINENQILVTLHNYGVPSIYYTEDGGVNWVLKEGDMLDIPIKAIKMNPDNIDEVIIGTNMGVWKTSNFTSTFPNWEQSFNGMSNVRVTKFDMRTSDNTIVASTYGRGLFTGAFKKDNLSYINDSELNKIEISNRGSVLQISNLTTKEHAVLKIYNMSGALVSTKQFVTNTPVFVADTQLITGVYVVNLLYRNKVLTKKVIIT